MTSLPFRIVFITLVLFGCTKDKVPAHILSQNLIIIFIDGPRLSETWNEPNHSFIPLQSELAKEGTLIKKLKNNGDTFTVPGHVAVCTGNYQSISNVGTELPSAPSIFQYWNEMHSSLPTKSWIIASKDKLEVLSDCSNSQWQNKFRPATDCGIAGLGSGYRTDSATLNKVFDRLNTFEPNLVLVNFREPDFSGHANDWLGYLKGIVDTDKYVDSIWNFIQNHTNYKNKTTLLVTNDHGRHLQGISDGYAGHGDNCEGCKNISLLALGPDIKKNAVLDSEYDLLDVNATIGYLMQTPQKHSKGKVIYGLFK